MNEKADTRRCQGNIIPLLFLTFFLSGWQLQDSECQTLENILAEVASAPLAYFLSSCIGSFRFVQVYHMTRVQMGCLGCFVFLDAIFLLLTFYSKETYVQTCMWKVVCAHNFTPVRGFPSPLSRFFASIYLGFLQGPWLLLKSVCGIKQIRPLLCGSAFQPAILPHAITLPICVDLSSQISTWVLRTLEV